MWVAIDVFVFPCCVCLFESCTPLKSLRGRLSWLKRLRVTWHLKTDLRLICPAQPFCHLWCCTYSVFTTTVPHFFPPCLTLSFSHTYTHTDRLVENHVCCSALHSCGLTGFSCREREARLHRRTFLDAFFSLYFLLAQFVFVKTHKVHTNLVAVIVCPRRMF